MGQCQLRRSTNTATLSTRSFTGIRGISEQDACIQDSQGPIYDRSAEHLGTTDVAIIEFRKLMLGMEREPREGVEPPHARRGEVYLVRSRSAVAPRKRCRSPTSQQIEWSCVSGRGRGVLAVGPCRRRG